MLIIIYITKINATSNVTIDGEWISMAQATPLKEAFKTDIIQRLLYLSVVVLVLIFHRTVFPVFKIECISHLFCISE